MSLSDVIDNHITKRLKTVYTTLPAQIVQISETPSGRTLVAVQTGVNYIWSDGRTYEDGIIEDILLVWPSSGGCSITCPIKVGDSVLVHFAMRNCDDWIMGGNSSDLMRPTSPLMNRSHDVNDAFAVPASLFFDETPNVDQEAIRISSGKTEIRVLTDGTIEFGEGAVERVLMGDTFLNKFLNHKHSYVDTTTGGPVPSLTDVVSTAPELPDLFENWEETLSEVTKTK